MHAHRISAGALALSIAGWPTAVSERKFEPHREVVARANALGLAIRENPLDTDVPPPPPRPRPPVKKPAPTFPPRPPNRKVRTPADEDLPPWVPISGRLTVIESCDLAENLGLAPLGTARDGGCPSVAELLAKEQAERRARTESPAP